MPEPSFEVLLGGADLPPVLTGDALAAAYAWPVEPSVRANFIATVDGIVTGSDGLSGSLGNPADRAVFELLRRTCDAIVVGAGTARAENYGPPPPGIPLVVVSRGAALPPRLITCADAILATTAMAGPGLERMRRQLGDERVWVLGESDVDAASLRARLIDRGHERILHEGGPTLFTQWLVASCIDELCLTTVPRIGLAGESLVHRGQQGVDLRPILLTRAADVLLGRWTVVRPDKV